MVVHGSLNSPAVYRLVASCWRDPGSTDLIAPRFYRVHRLSEALFKYSVRVSPRARNVRLRVSVWQGLEIVVPRGYDVAEVPRLIKRQESWIRQALERAESQKRLLGPEPVWTLPEQIHFPIAGRAWRVTARPTSGRAVSVRETGPGQLLLSGAVTSERGCRAALGRWLMRQASEHLPLRLEVLSRQTGLRYRRTAIRRQRTRWGSCSHQRSISLNAKLLFLPVELVDYVLIHELCHTVEMNHSRRFWDLVRRHCSNFKALDRCLRDAWKAVPHWAAK